MAADDVSLEVEEVSVGVYRVLGRAADGATVELRGTDPDSLREEVRRVLRERNTEPE